jgi:hypothetical protein
LLVLHSEALLHLEMLLLLYLLPWPSHKTGAHLKLVHLYLWANLAVDQLLLMRLL